jgi:hypothetical protein
MNKITSARIVIGFALVFVLLLAILHILEPEFNLGGHLISEYELGNYGWMMTLAFWCLGGASLFLAHSIRDDLRGTAGTIGFWWLLLIAVAYFAAGIFYPDNSTGGLGLPLNPADFKRGEIAPTLNATMHGIAGITVILSSPIVFTLQRKGLAKNPQWASSLRNINWATTAAWIGLLLFPLAMILYTVAQQPDGFDFRVKVSFVNRLMILSYAAWLAIVARQKHKLMNE